MASSFLSHNGPHQVVYLTARSMAFHEHTRHYLFNLLQEVFITIIIAIIAIIAITTLIIIIARLGVFLVLATHYLMAQ